MSEIENSTGLTDDQKKIVIEEYKEVGHEVRYRDVLLIQEFSISMGGIGLVGNFISNNENIFARSTILFYVGIALWLLSFHIRNINQDRIVGVHRKAELSRQLGFENLHQNVLGNSRLSAPRQMVRLMFVVSALWTVWTLATICEAVHQL